MNKNCYIAYKANMLFDAHLTLMFLGDLDKDRYEFAQQVVSTLPTKGLSVKRIKIELFGENNSIPVITVFNSLRLYNSLSYLEEKGLSSSSKYQWNPHITLKMDGTIVIPEIITLHSPYIKCD